MNMARVPLKPLQLPSLPPGGVDWQGSAPLDRVTPLPGAQQLFSPLSGWATAVGVDVWAIFSTSFSISQISFHVSSFFRSLCRRPPTLHTHIKTNRALLFPSTCFTHPGRGRQGSSKNTVNTKSGCGILFC